MPYPQRPPGPIVGDALFEYFIEHARAHANWDNIFEITKPLKVFKLVIVDKHLLRHSHAIANLLLPVGAFVHAPPCVFDQLSLCDSRKMRASEAIVHSLSSKNGDPRRRAWSDYDNAFIYTPGKRVMPRDEPFDITSRTCSSGIHFFLNVYDAFYYR